MSEAQTMPRKPNSVIKVTPKQVRAAQASIRIRQKLGRDVPPGLRRIAEAKPARTP